MSGFLDEMKAASKERVARARSCEDEAALERRALAQAPAPRLRWSRSGFDVIAEIKLRSPAAGVLGQASDNFTGRAAAYARAGAAAVSVLTEESRFDGSLEHLRDVAELLAPLGIPAMRKDFLVDPYQVLEARACGAGGVLVILRMLPPDGVMHMLDMAARLGLFVLLEAFDRADLEVAAALLARRRAAEAATILVGVNCRDLQTLEVRRERFAELAPHLPKGLPAVAESGVGTGPEAQAVRRLGYGLALIGTALMGSSDPASQLADILATARTGGP